MKSMTRILIVSAAATIIAASAFAQLSAENREWARGPVQFIMTPQEQQQWNQVRTDAEAKAFEDLFWARRDPSAGTQTNEYRDAFELAARYADEHFAEGRRKGSLTERGRLLVVDDGHPAAFRELGRRRRDERVPPNPSPAWSARPRASRGRCPGHAAMPPP